MRNVYIAYGFSEGGWNGRRFNKALKRFNMTATNNLPEADIIVAHSGGCFDLPPLRQSQLLVLINPTYWPGKTNIERANAVFKQNLHELLHGKERPYHLIKFFNFLYRLVWDMPKNIKMIKRADTFSLPHEITHRNTIIIRNHGDPWLTPDFSELKKHNPSLQTFTLDGYHDDCWVNPEPYIQIINQQA